MEIDPPPSHQGTRYVSALTPEEIADIFFRPQHPGSLWVFGSATESSESLDVPDDEIIPLTPGMIKQKPNLTSSADQLAGTDLMLLTVTCATSMLLGMAYQLTGLGQNVRLFLGQ